jgi:hypothetical protein
MSDNPQIYLDHEQRPDAIERRHDWRIFAHNQQARIRGALLRERRLARDLASTREDLRLTADALQREIERTTRLEDDLARARAVNEQAEKVRDENDRLRRDVAREREAHAATRTEMKAMLERALPVGGGT